MSRTYASSVTESQKLSWAVKLKTKTAAIDKALRHLAGQPLTTEEILAFEGANLIGEVPEDRFEHDPH